MKKIKHLLLFTTTVMLLGILPSLVSGSHIVGIYLTYTYLSPNNYQINLKMYRDCSGIAAPISPTICYSSASTGLIGNISLDTITPSAIQVPFNSCAAQGLTWCQGGSFYGIEEFTYEGFVMLPAAANDWVFSYSDCCRNNAITTGAANLGAYIEARLDNLSNPINSSPVFNSTLFGLYCIGTLTNINYQCTDADGDSLVYRLDSVMAEPTGSCGNLPTSISYISPYSYTYPVASFTPFSLNQSTGILSFTPAMIQIGTVSFVVDEYRNGVKIGSVKRDDQLVIVGENPDPAVAEGRVYFDANGNNTQDVNEPGMQNRVVTETITGIYALTDSSGDYHFNLIPGSFDLTTSAPTHFTVNPNMIPVNITTAPSVTSGLNFALAPDISFTDIATSITSVIPPRPGMPTSYLVSVANNGTQINNGNIILSFDAALTLDSCTLAGGVVSGNTITWPYTNFIPLDNITFTVYFTVATTAQVGDTLLLMVEATTNIGDKTPADNIAVLNPVVVASFDPNYKSVLPAGDVPYSFITNSSYLDYEIHFQNTGMSDAYYVKVLDGLDANLDVSSFEFLSSSHPCVVNLSSSGLLTFEFNNITLTPIFVNELNSTGFVRFRIKPKATLSVGDQIINGAGIVFDVNSPVYTSNVITKIVNTTGIYNPDNFGSIILYPNPVNNYFTVSNTALEAFSISVFDVAGRNVLTTEVSEKKLDVSALNAGIYSYKIISNGKTSGLGKFVKK